MTNNPQTTEPRLVKVPSRAMFQAFGMGKADGRYEIDEIRFNEFQRGWNAALNYINADTLARHYA